MLLSLLVCWTTNLNGVGSRDPALHGQTELYVWYHHDAEIQSGNPRHNSRIIDTMHMNE
ncbi:uncharacterized protein RSE6_07626 [Rhynchosporium secalis]|uniref:Uncharacterized protein n=1 Tax=Rhynchosporium secalis TaxID=38038 RepID=A0A1E1MDG2_RHYSE|nr:uncharacterized protein RSE6_07626 [Rhynchosporium secalis]